MSEITQNLPTAETKVGETLINGLSPEQKFEHIQSTLSQQATASPDALPNLTADLDNGFVQKIMDWLKEWLKSEDQNAEPLFNPEFIQIAGKIAWFCFQAAAVLLAIYLVYLLLKNLRLSKKVRLQTQPQQELHNPGLPIDDQLKIALSAGDQWGLAMRIRWMIFLENRLQQSHQTLLESVSLGLMDRNTANKFLRGMYDPASNSQATYHELDVFLSKANYKKGVAA